MAGSKHSRTSLMDEINIEIIRHLSDGRKTFKEIAQSLGVAENTVRSRVTKLIDTGILRIAAMVSPAAMPGHYTAYLGMNTVPDQAARIARELSELKGVIAAVCVTGRFDVMCFILFNEDYTMDEFMFEELPKIHGINKVEQFQIYKSYNHRCRYIL
ncbi:Lrp/AsnC family transcriptional regulator [Dethiosulfatarculus sandiegensis]|uniref:Transcriptional regulator n=1 Tax=Dethiosulfatarculus sandiegensis TaxID=1429043 RepID=A0A0D2GH97_9BACT|nr:Lrp/AsnC family transcriptional regulator [Dethiosulfatarculus sandiegensis]KIX14292.1 transcriptional regulator [Dethiosulfatarculus sandiegensis]